MHFYGKICKDEKFWLAEVPLLDAMTQGHTRKEVFVMVKDLLETLVNRPGFSVHVHPGSHDDFEVSSNDPQCLCSIRTKDFNAQSGKIG